jgi:hypothetical protein
MPAWTTPKQDWALNDIVTAPDLNAIGENLAYLKEQTARARVAITPASTGSAAWTTRASLSLTTRGGDIQVCFYAGIFHTALGRAYFDVALDGVRVALNGTDGSLELTPGGAGSAVQATMTLLLTGVAAGAHTVALQWRTDAAGLNLTHGQFHAIEV